MTPALAQLALWLTPLLPAVGGVALLVVRRDRFAPAVSLAIAAGTMLLAVLVSITQPAVKAPFLLGLDFALRVDPLSALVLPTVAVVTMLVLVFAVGDVRRASGRFHGLMLIFAAAALLTATAENLSTLLFAWEVMGATSYALIGFFWKEDVRMSAGLTAFLTTRAADLGLYFAAGAAVAAGAGLDFDDLAGADAGWRDAIAAGVVIAALGKAAQLPFSFWISRAMQGPSPVSALLHSAAMVALGSYLLLRVAPLLQATEWAGPTVAWVGAATAATLGIIAVAQRDLKQLLAASTSAQLGFVVLAAGLAAVDAGTGQLVAHAATKAALFLAAGAWLTALGTKRLTALAGVARRWKIVGVAASVALLSLAGVPPFALWATKDAILAAAREQSGWLFAVGMVGSVLSAAYSAKALWAIWRRPSPESTAEQHYDEEETGTRKVTPVQVVPIAILALGALTLGALALPPLQPVLATFLGEPGAQGAGLAELLVSGVLAIAVVLILWRFRLPEPRWAVGWLGMETAVHTVLVRPTLALARALARFDDRVLDRGVDLTAPATLTLADGAARADDDVVDRGVEGFAAAVRRAGRAARRPQTGQLHEYYLQGIVVLVGVGVVILLLTIG